METKRYNLKPFEYMFKDTVFSVNGENILVNTRYGSAAHELNVSHFQNPDFHKIKLICFTDPGVNDVNKLDRDIDSELKIFLDLTKKKGQVLYDINDSEGNVKSLTKVRLIVSALEERPLKVDYKGYSLTRKLAQILIEENIASELLISRGLRAIAHDDDYKLLEKYYIELARDSVIKHPNLSK